MRVCIVEVFGDTGIIELDPWRRAVTTLSRDLKLLDLRGNAAMRAGVTAELAKAGDYAFTQAWSRYFYDHSADYGKVDGLIYGSAHNDEDAIALYERAKDALECKRPCSLALSDPRLIDEILIIADYLGLEVHAAGRWP